MLKLYDNIKLVIIKRGEKRGMKRKLALVLAAIMVAGTLTGCQKSNNNSNVSETTQDQVNETNESTEGNSGETTDANQDLQSDIVIVGAGGAGMSAAIQAVQDGATNVVIIEKNSFVGGNTLRSTGGMNASETSYQEAEGIKDSNQLFFDDTMAGGYNLNDEDLVWTMVNNSAAAVDWVNAMGADLTVVGMFGGASVKRIHRPSDTSAVGPVLVNTFSKQLEELNIPVLLNTTANSIIVDESGKVTGIKASNEKGDLNITCKSVILATGGFGANNEMVVENKADLAGFSTTNQPGATGDGIIMATAIGADTVDMDQIQTHPTVNPDTQTMYTEGVRGNGAILVNFEGERFINELETRDVVSAAILEQTDGQAWLLFDETVRTSLSAIESYIDAGIVFEGDTIEELAEQIGVDAETLANTVTTYSTYVANGEDTDFGRESMESDLSTSKYYAALCAPAVHHTMGGLKIDTTSQVLDTQGNAIQGLYAAGEVTGGVHGGNRLGGNAVLDIVVFGRIAGESAVSYVEANGGHTESTIVVENDAQEEIVPEVDGNYVDGVYTGKGTGNGGEIEVSVTVEGGNVVSVELVSHNETPGIYESAEKNIVANVIRTQSTDVDTVSGATNSSKGIIEAIENALKDAVQ